VKALDLIITSVDRLVLARTYDISSWLRLGLKELCTQASWPSDEDCRRIGLEDVMRIARAREALRGCANILLPDTEQDSIVDGVFDLVDRSAEPGHEDATSSASGSGEHQD
jgi:hypothetical protein